MTDLRRRWRLLLHRHPVTGQRLNREMWDLLKREMDRLKDPAYRARLEADRVEQDAYLDELYPGWRTRG